jgi:signal transduction histidine kinase
MDWEKNIATVFWTGTSIMVFFAIGVVIFGVTYLKKFYDLKQKEQDRLLRACLEVERNERKKISSYLHDTVCNDIYAVSVYLSILGQDDILPEKKSRIVELQHLLDKILNKTRDISYMTMSPLLEFSGLVPALQDYFLRFNKLHTVQIRFECLTEVPVIDLAVSYEVYRILQEMANNMMKHGNVKKAKISIEKKKKFIIVKLQDDGIPFDIRREYQEAGGMGIKNIYSRLQKIGATLKQKRNKNGNKLTLKFQIND